MVCWRLAHATQPNTHFSFFLRLKLKKKKKKVKNLLVVPFSMLLAEWRGTLALFPAHILMSPLLTLLKKQKQKLHLLINLQFHFFFFSERQACFYAQIHILFIR